MTASCDEKKEREKERKRETEGIYLNKMGQI